jgi:hypothetical protein
VGIHWNSVPTVSRRLALVPPVTLGWPSVEPIIGPSAFPSSSVRRGGNGARLRAVAPMWPIPAKYTVPNLGVSPLKLGPDGLSASDPSPLVVFYWPSVEPRGGPSALPSNPDYTAPRYTPASTCDSTGGRPAPLHGQSNRPWDRPSEGPKWAPLGGPSVGPSGILIPSASCDVPMAPPAHSSRSARGNTCPLSDRRLFPRAEDWTPAKRLSQKEELRRLIARPTQQLNSSNSWSEFLSKCKDPRGDLHPEVLRLPHRATHLLNRLRVSGATVATSSAPWSLQQKLAALKRDSHQSAKQHVDFMCGEFVDMIKKGQWILLPASLVLNNRNLRLSPLDVVPQRERRPRTICNYSFFLVNDYTIELCPAESMQFGRALLRILQTIARSNLRLGPVLLSKIDISDGFYRIAIRSEDVPKLAVMFSTEPGEEQLIGLPLVLPMGWKC